MVSINRVDYFVITGNTYANLDTLRAVGARWDNGARMWTVQIHKHPLNNVKQKKALTAMLNKLEENGVRFIAWYIDGGSSK
jgi:hypothetical protein